MATTQPDAGVQRGAWYIVILLVLLLATSFVDRFILAVVVQPVSKELAITDTQVGLLLGAGFAIVYSLAGIPIANAIDNGRRQLIIVIGVLIWSVMTILSAYSWDFWTLAFCRLGVAAGEAVLTPAAVSLIGDLFPREKRATPVSVYAATSSVMNKGALFFGAGAYALATVIAGTLGLAPWRMALVVVGVPGLILAFLFLFTVREPARRAQPGAAAAAVDLRAFGRYLRDAGSLYLPFCLGTAANSATVFGIVSWSATLMVRDYALSVSAAGMLIGLIGVGGGLTGSIMWPRIVHALDQRGRADAILICNVTAAALTLPFMLMLMLPGQSAVVAGLLFATICLATTGTLTPLAMQTYGPARMRARLMALQLLAINLVGYSVGPVAVPLFAKWWPGSTHALGYGLAVLAVLAQPIAVIGFALARRALLRRPELAARE